MLDKRVDSRGMRMPVSSEPSTVVPDLPRPGGVSSEKARAENHFAGAYQADDRYAGVAEQALDLLVESNGFDVRAYLQHCSRTVCDLSHFVHGHPVAAAATLESSQAWANSVGPQRAFLWRYAVDRAQASLRSDALRAAKASGEGSSLLSSSTVTYQDALDTFLPSSSLQTAEAIRLLAASGPSHTFECHQLLRVAMEHMVGDNLNLTPAPREWALAGRMAVKKGGSLT
ncbi:MAG: hypothetical protein WDW36_009767 [Sanguina aurantia]